MNDKLIEMYAVLAARLHTASRDERGQGTLEYVGIAVVAAILVTAVVDALANGSAIRSAIETQIQKIISKGGA
jgi:hypothetical protein